MSNKNTNFIWKIFKDSLPELVKTQWDNLLTSDPNSCASSSRVFFENYLTVVLNIYYAVGYNDGNLVCVLPLTMCDKKNGTLKYKCLGLTNHSNSDLFFAAGQTSINEADAIVKLKKQLKKEINQWDYFSTENWLLLNSVDKKYIQTRLKRKAAFFKLDDITDIREITSHKLIKNLTRLETKLIQSYGDTHLEKLTKPEKVQQGLDDFYEIEVSGWKGKSGSAIKSHPGLENFYNKTWQAFSESGHAVIFSLKSKNKSVASAIAFQNAKNLYLHKICYLESYQQYSPGSLLIKKIIEHYIEKKDMNKICFNTDPLWIQRWHPKKHELKTIHFFNNSLKAYILKFLYKVGLFLD
jgi:hypothetical protein